MASLAPSFGTCAFAQLPTLPVGLPEITCPKIGAQARSEAVVDHLPAPIGTGSKDEVLQTLAVMSSTSSDPRSKTSDDVWLDVGPGAWKLGRDSPTGSTKIFQIDVSHADPAIDISGLVRLTVGDITLCGLTNAPDSLASIALPPDPKLADLVDVAQKQVALVQYALGREKTALDVEQGVLNPATAALIDANNKLSDATPAGGVTISSPKSGATVSGTVSVVVQNVAPVSWVNFYIDGNWVASSPPYTMAWNSTGVANGQYAIAVNGYNSSNALVATTAMNVNVQNGGSPSPTPAPTGRSTAKPTATPSSTAFPGYYSLLPAGSALPSDSQCASGASGDNFEPVPQNAPQNTYTPSASDLSTYVFKASSGEGGAPGSYLMRADGQFSGTTDAILKWASCKWGFDENVTRATAVNETHWRQTEFGDIGNGTSIGILQIKSRDYPSSCEAVATSQNTSLVTDATCYSYLSTAFAADYKLAQQRACFEGKVSYMIGEAPAGYPSYPNGTPDQMMWGCVGWWYSGHWYDSGAVNYISQVKGYLAGQPWLSGGVGY